MVLKAFYPLKSFLELLKTAEFSKGISFAVAAILPVLLSRQMGHIEVGIPMAIGVLLCSPSDVPGSLRRRMTGVSFSVLMAFLGTLLAGYAAKNNILFVPILAFLMFSFSMIAVYGFRASLIAFSGLFAVVLSMARIPSEGTVFLHAFLVGVGGIWYLIFTVSLHYLNRKKERDRLLSEGFGLTADYLEIRNKLLRSEPGERQALKQSLSEVQNLLNEKHEMIREVLISRRKNSGRSGEVRTKLLVFMDLVDLLELAMANPVNYERMEELLGERKEQLESIRQWSEAMAEQVRELGNSILFNSSFKPSSRLEEMRKEVWQEFSEFESEAVIPRDRETLLVLRNLLVFKDRQFQKIQRMGHLLQGRGEQVHLVHKDREVSRFLTTQQYNWKTLVDNLDLKSPIFRHALRLTTVLVVGFLLGKLFHFQNAYWILLTSLVIMRPGYALTRDRFKQRLYGTLIGGAIAIGIVLTIQNPVVYIVLALISLVLAFSMLQRNYKTAAAFITLNVVFLYSLIIPNALDVIQYRVLDTFLGAGLAFLGNKFLWPTWEYTNIKNYIAESIKANKAYLEEIAGFYRNKGARPASYKLARKRAFLALGDLSAAFQRMAQEPKSGETELGDIFNLVSLNQELLSASASMGTYIVANNTTKASTHFENYMKAIDENLQSAADSLELNLAPSIKNRSEIEEAELYFQDKLKELTDMRAQEREVGLSSISDELRIKFQEVQIITEQLHYLLDLSENLKNLAFQLQPRN